MRHDYGCACNSLHTFCALSCLLSSFCLCFRHTHPKWAIDICSQSGSHPPETLMLQVKTAESFTSCRSSTAGGTPAAFTHPLAATSNEHINAPCTFPHVHTCAVGCREELNLDAIAALIPGLNVGLPDVTKTRIDVQSELEGGGSCLWSQTRKGQRFLHNKT